MSPVPSLANPALLAVVPPLLLLLFLPATSALAQTDYSVFDERGFYMEYPSSWEIADTWQQDARVSFQSDYSGKTGVTVARVDLEVDPASLDQDWVDSFGNKLKAECRANKNGQCWFFELLDSKIVWVGGQAAASVKYSQTLNDEGIVVRTILLPDGQKAWHVGWRALEGSMHLEGLLEGTVDSFSLPGPKAGAQRGGPHAIDPGPPPPAPGIVIQRSYDVNLVLVGGQWSNPLKSKILEGLPAYRDPMYVKSMEMTGIRHNYNYNFASVPGEDVAELAGFMERNSVPMPIFGSDVPGIAYWQAGWAEANHPEWDDLGYRAVDAVAVEEYLHERIIGGSPELAGPGSVNLVFLALDLGDADYLRNYYVDSTDGATRGTFTAHGLMGFGGNYNMLFFDLYAAPWIDWDLASSQYHYPQWIETLHDCDSSRCLAEMVSFHAGESLRYVVSPHLLYRVTDADRYAIEALVYIKPGGQATITASLLDDVVDAEKIERELSYLYPHAEWEVNISVERRDTRGLSYDFKKALESTSHHTLHDVFGDERTIQLLRTDDIGPHLVEWGAAQRPADGQARVIPVLIEVDSSGSFDVYLDRIGVLGLAPAVPDSDEPCCAFGVTSQKKVWHEKIAFTDLLIHEAGHALGLMHPFMSVDEYGDLTVNEYFNWYASPMTYSFPNSGCGTLFYLRHSEPCGNASLSFTGFEKNIITDARLAALWAEAEASMRDGKGAGASGPLGDSKAAYRGGDVYSPRGALALAKEAVRPGGHAGAEPAAQAPETAIPPWVRTSAGWWAEGAVDDDSFMRAIQYMIREGIIVIRDLPEGSGPPPERQIPPWVRTSAGWWAEGMIGEGDFVNGIRYMVEKGLIRVG